MWSNNNATSSRPKAYRKVANVKGYLGGFGAGNQQQHDDDVMSFGDLSSLGGSSALEMSTRTISTTTTTTTAGHRLITDVTSCPRTKERLSPRRPSVLVEIPENFPRDLINEEPRDLYNRQSSSPTVEYDVHVAEIERLWHQRRREQNDSSVILEIEENIFDMDNYLLSVYMNDDASIYTTATTTNSSFSSGSSDSSTISTRRRHRGAYGNRRRTSNQAQERKGTWVDSMRESSNNVFLDGRGSWTPVKGWSITPKSRCEVDSENRWTEFSWNVFESVSNERLEI
jgi:hypothetical protein